MTTATLDALTTAVARACALWPGEVLDGAEAGVLLGLTDTLGQAKRLLDAALVQVSAEVARQSRPELGADGLSRRAGGKTNPKTFLGVQLGVPYPEAAKLVQVGDAIAPRVLLTGDHAPARHPHIAAAITAGRIGTAAATAIITMLDKVALRARPDQLDWAEGYLADYAARGASLDDLNTAILECEAGLDPDGVAPREEELRSQECLKTRFDAHGGLKINGYFGPEHAAPVNTFLGGFIGSALAGLTSADDTVGDRVHSDDDDLLERELATPSRTSIPQLQAEAFAIACQHMLDCDQNDAPTGGATIIVRIDADDLETGTGHATIDDVPAPISIETARRMAAAGGVIPAVLNSKSEILDWGRERRLFTPAQKLAIAERDKGCAMCGAPLAHTKVHHLRWWKRHQGKTDLNNGVCLCTRCHHLIHDQGWDIHIDGNTTRSRVWFIPPPWLDPHQQPRPGLGRRHHTPA